MFGSRLKTWMENYIGLSRKKEAQKEKSKRNDGGGVIVESSESLACSDTGISFSSQQVLSSSATDNKEGYSTTTMESERSGVAHCHTAVSLPSPESAYSTGYSTDGASPGETGPPEYYINIRTGKHYFPSPAPTPTSPRPNADFPPPQACSRPPDPPRLPCPGRPAPRLRALTAFPNGFHPRIDSSPPELPVFSQNTLSASAPNHFETLNFSKSPCKKSSPISQLTPMKLFLKSPRHEKGKSKPSLDKTPASATNKKSSSSGKPKKWFKQPFQKFGHRRMDSCDENAVRDEPKKEVQPQKSFRYVLGQENSASPRQRNRIKTNPWLPTEPASSHNFHCLGVGFSPCSTRNRSCSNTPLQNRKAAEDDFSQDRAMQSNVKIEESRSLVKKWEPAGSRPAGGKLPVELSDHSEEDLTLNEVMGTYNESYVYEKETDILSDSDPTDCEEYGSDSEADNGGDERDSHDDELDFIDNGSLYECEDDFPQNTGRCTYHDVHVKKNSVHKGDRRKLRKDSDGRKMFRKDQDSKMRRDKRRQTRRSAREGGGGGEEEEEGKKIFEEKAKVKAEDNGKGSNLSRVLAQRLLARKASKSAEGTPVTARRQKLTTELRETHIGGEGGSAGEGRLGVVGDVVLIDFEADLKYKELMKEAENMFESMRNSPVVKNRKEIHAFVLQGETSRRGDQAALSADFQKKGKVETCFRRESKDPATPSRKTPKELDLKLSVETPKKPRRLDFGRSERSSFKRPSAHSPLDPLGPALRNFAVFDPPRRDDRKASTSSSEDSEPRKPPGPLPGKKGCSGRWGGLPASPVVPIAFQSVDLGTPLAPYCPQSEPVKRKIYSCSKTYDKLVKQFENKNTVFEETKDGKVGSASRGTKGRDSAVRPNLETCLHGNQGPSLGDRRDGEKAPRGGILRHPPFAPHRPCAADKPQRPPLHSPILSRNREAPELHRPGLSLTSWETLYRIQLHQLSSLILLAAFAFLCVSFTIS